MTREGFVQWLRPWMEAGIAFSAYWHPHGFGRLRTAPLPTERRRYIIHMPGKPDKTVASTPKSCSPVYRTPGAWVEPVYEPGPPKALRKGALERWRKSVEQLRRRSWDAVITVEFDGRHTLVEGGELEF